MDLTKDGRTGVTTIARLWAAGADLDEADVSVQVNGGPRQEIATRAWANSTARSLSYSELGALVPDLDALTELASGARHVVCVLRPPGWGQSTHNNSMLIME